MNPTVCRIHFFVYAAGSSPLVFKSKQRNRNSVKCSRSAKKPSLSGKVSALPTEEVIAFPFGEGVGIADGRGHCLPFWGRCRHCRRKRSLRREVFPLGGLYVSFYLIWGKCRRCETLLSTKIKKGKEGLFQIENKRAISIKTNS